MKFAFLLCLALLPASTFAGPKKPTITGQKAVSTNEDQAFTIRLIDLEVSDPDDFFYPLGFTLKIYDGPNYTFQGSTVTPAPNFSGTLTVKVSVNDGQGESNKYNMLITVNAVNDAPLITGQVSLSTDAATPITLKLADLIVSDVDNAFPTGFTLTVQSGTNYTVSGTTVTPNAGVTGTLLVNVLVNDGVANSPPYNLSITVNASNKKPVITGQIPLTIAKNSTFTVLLSHLTVSDPDNSYPNDFSLIVSAGTNYTVSGVNITPAQNFVGTLSVTVAVNDGSSQSDAFALKIEAKDALSITSQEAVEIDEDQKFTIQLSHLQVYDPNNQYPAGYQVKLVEGENYTFNGSELQPAAQFFGTLNVGVTVTNGTVTSPVFNFVITVKPLNDAPAFAEFPSEAIAHMPGNGPVAIAPLLDIVDPDDTYLILIEIAISPDHYQPGSEKMTFTNTDKIQGLFDVDGGKLVLLGQATHAEYEQALQNVYYDFISTDEEFKDGKSLQIRLNDGEVYSIIYQRSLSVGDGPELDIPNVFSPNNDSAHDTWTIRPYRPSERLNNALVRVFNQRGLLVFETSGFDQSWDGKYKGAELPPGTYFYTIDLNQNFATRKLTGTVTILR